MPASPLVLVETKAVFHRRQRRPGERPERSSVEICEPFEHRKQSRGLLRMSRDLPFDGRMIGEQASVESTPFGRPPNRRRRVESSDEHVIDACRRRAAESPLGRSQFRERARVANTEVEVTAEKDRLAGLSHPVDEHGCAQQLGVRRPACP